MEEENGTEEVGEEGGSHHAGLEWEEILRSYHQEGGHPIIPTDCQLVERDWGKPLLTQLPWEDVLFDSLLPCLQVITFPPIHLLTIPLFQPKDWLALSQTCKSCNRMVSLLKIASC